MQTTKVRTMSTIRLGQWQWSAFFGLAMISLLVFYDAAEGSAISGILPKIQQDLHLTYLQVFLLSYAATAFYTLGAIPLALLADCIQRIPIIAIGGIFSGIIVAVTFVTARSFGLLLVLRTLSGGGDASYTAPMQSAAMDYICEPRRTGFMAWMLILGAGGAVFGAATASIIAVRFSWETVFLVNGLAIILISAGFLLVREPPRYLRPDVPRLTATIGAQIVRNMLNIPLLRLCIFGMAAFTVTTTTLGGVLSLFLSQHYHVQAILLGTEVGIIFLGSVPGAMLSSGLDWVIIEIYRRKDDAARAPLRSRTLLAGLGAVSGSLLFILTLHSLPSLPLFIVLATLTSACFGAAAAPIQALVTVATPPVHRTTGYMLQGVVVALLGATLTIAFGSLADQLHALALVMGIATLPMLFAGVVFILVSLRQREVPNV